VANAIGARVHEMPLAPWRVLRVANNAEQLAEQDAASKRKAVAGE
jgi:hypothetical protein